MTVKCKKCGNSYDSKYRVCPQCGTVRFVAPAILRVLALIAGGYLVLTALMLPLGLFQFKPELTGVETEKVSPSPKGETASPLPSDVETKPPAPSAGFGESAVVTDGERDEGQPKAPEKELFTVKSIYGKYKGNNGFIWYKEREPLQLSIDPKPKESDPKPKWESSDNTVFTVDENGLVTGIWGGSEARNAFLTVTYGTGEVQINVTIYRAESTIPPAAPSQAPETDRGVANND